MVVCTLYLCEFTHFCMHLKCTYLTDPLQVQGLIKGLFLSPDSGSKHILHVFDIELQLEFSTFCLSKFESVGSLNVLFCSGFSSRAAQQWERAIARLIHPFTFFNRFTKLALIIIEAAIVSDVLNYVYRIRKSYNVFVILSLLPIFE